MLKRGGSPQLQLEGGYTLSPMREQGEASSSATSDRCQGVYTAIQRRRIEGKSVYTAARQAYVSTTLILESRDRQQGKGSSPRWVEGEGDLPALNILHLIPRFPP